MFTLTTLYFAQNKLIYPSNMPFQYPHQNPAGYKHPGERNLLYKEIETTTADNIKLKGWFIHQRNPVKQNTVVFMHENAGNIGLRLDFYEALYH